MKNWHFERVIPARILELVSISIETFTASFYHLNDPTYFNQYLAKAFSHDTLLAELASNLSVFYFLITDDQVIGYYKLNIGLDPNYGVNPSHAELQRIYLRTSHQGHGYGKIMVQHATDLMTVAQIKTIWLGVWEHNPAAIRFYLSLGFEKISEHIFWMGDDKQTDWIMHKKLYSVELLS